MPSAVKEKRILRIEPKYEVMEGAGVVVGRALPNRRIPFEEVDPFLLWDEAEIDPRGPAFPRHPHRGFEILTYILKGWAKHLDSLGNKAEVHAGGLMRITAGSGLWHDEGFGEKNHENVRGIQFWVNLAQEEKHRPPAVQWVGEKDLPVEEKDGVWTKTLVGEGSPVQVVTPMLYLEVRMQPGAVFERDIREGYGGFTYLMDGEGFFGGQERAAEKGDMVVFEAQGSRVRAAAKGKTPVHFMMAMGRPHRQPVKWRGPYVD